VNRRLMESTGIERYIVDTGFQSSAVQSPDEVGSVTGKPAHEIVRLEAVAESVAKNTTAEGYDDAIGSALESATQGAVGLKSVMAYRYGLDFDPTRPTSQEVRAAADEWLRSTGDGAPRMDHPVLLRDLVWRGVDTALPMQFHVGYGDSDITLHRCDPTHMTEFIRATRTKGTRIMLLHCYPFIREAGFLAQVYPHVYLDTGAITHYTGWSSHHMIRHSLELAPFDKVLFSSDAFGHPELYACGAALWRRGIKRLFGEWLDADEISAADAERYIRWVAADNAKRVYGWSDDS
jgi:predicted TIM-barrel fold metal-dependent hydrolase